MQNLASPVEALAVNDNLILPEVGTWAADKHRKISYYAALFSKSMKNKWDCRVFIDLFAGAGFAKIKDSTTIVPGSPLVTLGLECPFDRYIFCEFEKPSADALKTRVDHHFPNAKTTVLNIDSNAAVDKILGALPQFSRSYKGLSLCFVDPYKTSNLKFATLKKLSDSILVDFIVLIPSFMDIKRNCHVYTRPTCKIVDEFLGTSTWRSEWQSGNSPFKDFGVFIADQFGKQMATLGYIYPGVDNFVTVRIGEDYSLYLYHLGFFSKSPLGGTFWREATQRTSKQLGFDLD